MHHVGHITEELVQFTNALLDIADLGLTLDDQRFLEVDLALISKDRLLLLKLLL